MCFYVLPIPQQSKGCTVVVTQEMPQLKSGDWLRIIHDEPFKRRPEGGRGLNAGDYVQYLEPASLGVVSIRYRTIDNYEKRDDTLLSWTHLRNVERVTTSTRMESNHAESRS